MEFKVEQTAYSGPLGLLLELLDSQKLEIKDVALAGIADEYLKYLDENEVNTNELADFLVVASRLIYLKSRQLMPYLRIEEEDTEVASLEDQLRLYRMFVRSAEKLEELYTGERHSFARPFIRVRSNEPTFNAPENVTISNLHSAFESLMKKLEPFFALQKASIIRIKSVEERLSELTKAIQSRASMKFQDIIVGASNKAEVVVSFLALLELMRRQIVTAKQKGGEITIQRI
ncbi:MAG: segregation/condensation protein A [Candidatus Uhrbacteria bacterium]|nr:segregation/condensation protein A [Candidatus Uhrbacteria bacterium]